MGNALVSFEQPSVDSRLARSLHFQGGHLFIHADSHDTHGHFALLEFKGKTGTEPPLHVHRYEDEMFYVLEGKLRVYRGTEELILQAGESGFLPRNLPHTFQIMSSDARFLVYITPGGFEGYFRDLCNSHERVMTAQGPDIPAIVRVAERYGLTFVA